MNPFRLLLALIILPVALILQGCVTDPETGQKHFNPWKAAQKMDEGIDHYLDESAAAGNRNKVDTWNQ